MGCASKDGSACSIASTSSWEAYSSPSISSAYFATLRLMYVLRSSDSWSSPSVSHSIAYFLYACIYMQTWHMRILFHIPFHFHVLHCASRMELFVYACAAKFRSNGSAVIIRFRNRVVRKRQVDVPYFVSRYYNSCITLSDLVIFSRGHPSTISESSLCYRRSCRDPQRPNVTASIGTKNLMKSDEKTFYGLKQHTKVMKERLQACFVNSAENTAIEH